MLRILALIVVVSGGFSCASSKPSIPLALKKDQYAWHAKSNDDAGAVTVEFAGSRIAKDGLYLDFFVSGPNASRDSRVIAASIQWGCAELFRMTDSEGATVTLLPPDCAPRDFGLVSWRPIGSAPQIQLWQLTVEPVVSDDGKSLIQTAMLQTSTQVKPGAYELIFSDWSCLRDEKNMKALSAPWTEQTAPRPALARQTIEVR